jgi:outer membrane protein TolC
MNKRFFLLLIAICCFFSLQAQDTSGYDLKRCISYALENSYLNKSNLIDAEERYSEYRTAKSKILPSIDFYMDYYKYFNDLPTYIFPSEEGNILSGGTSGGPYPVGLGLPHNLNAGLDINQVIFDRNFILTQDLEKNLEKLDQLQSQFSRETIIYDVTLNYYKLASLYSKKELLLYNLERLSKIEKLVDIQIENGFARSFDKGKVEINRTKLLSGIDQLDAGIEQLEGYIKFLMGMPVETDINIVVESIEVNPGRINENYPDSLSNTQQELLDTKIELLELQKDAIKGDYFLTLNAFAKFRLQAQREAFNFFEGNQDWFLINLFGVRLDIPIYHGGEKKKKMEASTLQSDKVRLNKIKLQENLKMQFENSRIELINSLKNIEYSEKNVFTSKNMYEQTSALFEEGLAMLSDLLEVEATYREAENSLITARYGYKIAELNYLKSTGNLLTYSQDL